MKTGTVLCKVCGRVIAADVARGICGRCKSDQFRTLPLARLADLWPTGNPSPAPPFRPARGAPPPRR